MHINTDLHPDVKRDRKNCVDSLDLLHNGLLSTLRLPRGHYPSSGEAPEQQTTYSSSLIPKYAKAFHRLIIIIAGSVIALIGAQSELEI